MIGGDGSLTDAPPLNVGNAIAGLPPVAIQDIVFGGCSDA
jgi:hypothetical protein